MRTAYPRFYQNIQLSDARVAVELWYDMFKNDDAGLVKTAVSNLIQELEFPPTIADVRKAMGKIISTVTHEPTAIDEWNEIRKAIKNSIYNAQEMFDKLPSAAKKFVGSPQQLRDWAMMCDFNEAVIRGQFLKQYDVIKDRETYQKMLERNPEVQKLLEKGQENEENI